MAREPPEIVTLFEDERPPAEIPPANVEVAVVVALINPYVGDVDAVTKNV